ncbi:MAG: hypothetical protein BWY82_02614 [Verrucomicrobia bacterium ADurb.Bin474]|nr:MAG: hypothetical protein BWY82_02614 [Verrucomicrobia bacterium ADurb.Bin474]
MDIHPVVLGNQTLKMQRQLFLSRKPDLMSDPVSGDGLESFVVEQGIEMIPAGRVPFVVCHDVLADAFHDFRMGVQRLQKDVVQVGLPIP